MHAGNGVHFFNTLTGNRYDEKAQLDLNLDGVFDDRDKEVFYDFNFAVLASSSSFSSANTMPIMCKDNGVCVLGEKAKEALVQSSFRLLRNPTSYRFPVR